MSEVDDRIPTIEPYQLHKALRLGKVEGIRRLARSLGVHYPTDKPSEVVARILQRLSRLEALDALKKQRGAA